VEVEDGLISLAWTAFSEDSSTSKVEYFYKDEAVRLGIPYDLLLNAVLEVVEAIDDSGHYPVTKEIGCPNLSFQCDQVSRMHHQDFSASTSSLTIFT